MQDASRYRFELNELMEIARAINSERDPTSLLGLILQKSRLITGADAGSIYVVEPHPARPGERLLRFEVAQNDSVDMELDSITMEISRRSVVGAAVLGREAIRIPDMKYLEQGNPWAVAHDRSIDQHSGYQTRSMLTVPLVNNREEVIGVLQLINKKAEDSGPLRTEQDFDERVLPFDQRSVELCCTLASQAAISLENTLLYAELKQVFEGFCTASIQAVEARDPSTSGHSRRVADLVVAMAAAVNRAEDGPFAEVTFSAEQLKTLEYAGLLHDFGKIGVDEQVLIKANKLHDWERDLILARFDYIRQWLRAENLQRRLSHGDAEGAAELAAELSRRLAAMDTCTEDLLEANRPSPLDPERQQRIRQLAHETYVDSSDSPQPYLRPEEVESLCTGRGSLSREERQHIESHVIHTFNFLVTIPWGRSLRDIPAIAGDHHERPDGSGYPQGKSSREISLAARMMAIADVYDALTSADRPYRRALSPEVALKILGEEAERRHLDPELLSLFVEQKIYLRGDS